LLDGVANVVVDSVELLLKVGDVAREPSGEVLAGSLTTRLVSMPIISMSCRRRPTSSTRWFLSGSGRGRASGWTLGEESNHLRIERVGLG
jgi:hypothetical protein